MLAFTLLPVLLLSRGAVSALLQRNETQGLNHSAVGISLADPIPFRKVSKQYTHPEAPGADIDPPGVAIYDSLADVSTARLLSRARSLQKCYAARPCWAAYVCGHRCEQVLMRVSSWCRDRSVWNRCQKARKFMRCFARVCFRTSGRVKPKGRPPASYEDKLNVAIIRYRRPLPKHEILAKRNKQSSTQSAIFK